MEVIREEGVCPSSPKKARGMPMAIILPSSVESCGGGHGISSKEEEVCHSGPKEGVVTMVIFFHTSVESCGGGHSISSKKEEVCHSSPKKDRSMTRVIFFFSSVESCGSDSRRGVLPF